MTIGAGSIGIEYLNPSCDLCNSEDVIETTQGYVCAACGIELNVKKLQYDRPYIEGVLQYAKGLGKTQIGNKKERLRLPNSRSLERLSWHNSKLVNEESVKYRAQREISRIFEVLDLPRKSKVLVVDRFTKVRARLRPRSRLRNPEKLSAVLVYMVSKLENIAIVKEELIKETALTLEEFNRFFIQVRQYLPEYSRRDRITAISQKLLEITKHFGLEMPFYFLAKKMLHCLWNAIKNTTDSVVAGLCASMTALCCYKGVINVSSICELLSIKMSTVQFQVKRRVFNTFSIRGFKSLVRSSDLLRKFVEKIGLISYVETQDAEISSENELSSEEPKSIGVEVRQGNAQRIFNPYT